MELNPASEPPHRPIEARSYSRSNLSAKLDRQRPPRLIELIAPAGYGKTTAAKSLVHDLDAASVWLPIDERCRTQHLFSQQLTGALVRAGLSLVQALVDVDRRPDANALWRHGATQPRAVAA